MSHFGDLIGKTSPKTEPAVVVEPDPVVEETVDKVVTPKVVKKNTRTRTRTKTKNKTYSTDRPRNSKDITEIITLWDERLSSQGAFNLSNVLDANTSKKVSKLDENSAQFILQGVLDFYHKKNT